MKLMDMVLDAGHSVASVYADAAYDCKDNYRQMRDKGITFTANVKGSFDDKRRCCNNGRFRGCAERARHIKFIIEYGREEWKRFVNYSRRWKVEGTFSDMKQLFGDTIRPGTLMRQPMSSIGSSGPSTCTRDAGKNLGGNN